MQKLEKILEEIEMKKKKCLDIVRVEIDPMEITIHREQYKGLRMAEDIIRKHMNDGWIPVEQELPPNSKHKGAFCPRYQVMTKYGVTEGWYNPDYESWYILCWFMGNDHLKHEIDFERGTFPKVVRCENSVNDKHGIVIAWQPLPEPYHPERSDNHDRE